MKKPFFGVRRRMILWMLLIFTAGTAMFAFLLKRQLNAQMESQIRGELLRVWQDANFYSRQLLVAGGLNNDSRGFEAIAGKLRQEFPGAYAIAFGEPLEGEQAVCRMEEQEAGSLEIFCTMPVLVEGKQIGSMTVSRREEDLPRNSREFLRLALRLITGLFAAVFLFCTLTAGRLFSPLLRLSRLSRQVTELVDAREMEDLPFPRANLLRRRDEAGELARNFSRMLETIRRQFLREEEDREKILRLAQTRQHFFDMATHELKTPLTTIQGYAQLIREDGGCDRELLDQGLEHIQKESARLHQMVVQMLELSGEREQEAPCRFELGGQLRETVDSLRPKARRYGSRFLLEAEEDLWIVARKNQIRQLLINLLDNAVKYGTPATAILVEGLRRDQHVLIRVTNEGEPIPDEALSRIFTPFYRVDKKASREQGSAGLGLSICRKIAEDQGGRIWAENLEGGRIRFTVSLAAGKEEGEAR